jgi:hypothetical protein
MGVDMRTTAVHGTDRWTDEVRPAVILEGFAALVALIAFIGAICGALTWGLVRLASLVLG